VVEESQENITSSDQLAIEASISVLCSRLHLERRGKEQPPASSICLASDKVSQEQCR
jgi:hypothetical protein